MQSIFKRMLLISIAALIVVTQPADARRAYAYVANYGSNTVSVIDTTSNTVVSTIPVASGPLAWQEFLPEPRYMSRISTRVLCRLSLFPTML